MASRRRFLVGCCAGASLSTAGCLAGVSRPDIPRDVQVIDDRTTIEPGSYHAWSLPDRVRDAPLTPVDDALVFSYEFAVDRGPPVTLAVTSPESLERRAETGRYKVFAGTRVHGRRGHASETLSVSFLERFVADAQHVGPNSPPADRNPATVHVQAYLSAPDRA